MATASTSRTAHDHEIDIHRSNTNERSKVASSAKLRKFIEIHSPTSDLTAHAGAATRCVVRDLPSQSRRAHARAGDDEERDYMYHHYAQDARMRINVGIRRRLAPLLDNGRRRIELMNVLLAFGRGCMESRDVENHRILAFMRRYEDDTILMACNLSNSSEPTELDLREFAGWKPVEMWSDRPFPPMGELPSVLTFARFGYYWFRLQKPEAAP